MEIDLRRPLEVATAAARTAGELLRRDFHRAGGARGGGDKAEADTEAERLIRAELLAAFPRWSYLGEETGAAVGEPGEPLWLVDPNDGTRDYLKGRRGSAVSIGLLVDSIPRLGVVFAFAYPDDAGDLFAWAEGCGALERNGGTLAVELPATLGLGDVVLVSSGGDRNVGAYLDCVGPSRYRALPSIAHRLALVAAGEASAAVSLHRPGAWDYGAGHALLRGVGATLLDENGREVSYGADGRSRCRLAFGGRDSAVRPLVSRPWREAMGPGREVPPEGFPTRLQRGQALVDPGRLARAQGCLLGQVAGDSLGALVEFQSQDEISRSRPGGPRQLEDGGVWNLIAGQPTDDSEMALALARAIVARGRYEKQAAGEAYVAWLRSRPFDVGRTVGAALRGAKDAESQANGALMRVSPIAVFAHALAVPEAAALGREDASLTHPNVACTDANAAFVVAVAHAIRHGDGPEAAWRAAREWAAETGAAALVQEALEGAAGEPPPCGGPSAGWVRIALQNAFFELLHAPDLEEGVVATVRRGGDTDTNAAVAGALLGAVYGRGAVPDQWRRMILSCRPLARFARVPRPYELWPVDVLEIAERLLLAGEHFAGRSR